MSSKSIEESLIASVWMLKDITGQTMNQVMTLCSVMLLNGFVLLICFHHNHFLQHSAHILMRHL